VAVVWKKGCRGFFSSATLPLHSAKQGPQEGQAEEGVEGWEGEQVVFFFSSPA